MDCFIKPIETHYKGYAFRSRLEARWAVFFDMIGTPWEYEKEGFEGNGIRYLPDFYFPDLRCWGEVKPSKLSWEQFRKASMLPGGCILLDGVPDERLYFVATDPTPIEFDAYVKNANLVSRISERESRYRWCWIELYLSLSGKRLAWNEGHDIAFYRCSPWKQAITAARSARFEFGERDLRSRITPAPQQQSPIQVAPVKPVVSPMPKLPPNYYAVAYNDLYWTDDEAKLRDLIVARFYRERWIHLDQDVMAMQRLHEKIRETVCALRDCHHFDDIEFSVPFISSNRFGPLHIDWFVYKIDDEAAFGIL